MLNTAFNDDMESAEMKALRLYIYNDVFASGIAITVKTGWDGVYKRNKFEILNPLTWIMDPAGDYFTGNYKYTGFYTIKTRGQLEAEGYDPDDMISRSSTVGAIETKERMQRIIGLFPNKNYGSEIFDVYTHFTTIGTRKVFVKTANMDSVLLDAGYCQPNNALEEKNEEAIKFPLAFYYWKPDRDNPYGDRVANYVRDIQLQKAEIANLRLNKMRAELYPMYLYNKDYVSGKDLAFGFNK